MAQRRQAFSVSSSTMSYFVQLAWFWVFCFDVSSFKRFPPDVVQSVCFVVRFVSASSFCEVLLFRTRCPFMVVAPGGRISFGPY
jgi:hypothetical protein